MYRVYEVLYLDEAKENAAEWRAGRDDRLRWLAEVLGLDPLTASLTELWAAVVRWYDAGGAQATGAPCPVWWVDEYDVDDTLAMADALGHLFCDELCRREPGIQIEICNQPATMFHRQLVMALGRWDTPPWYVPHMLLGHLAPDAPQRAQGASTAGDYLERQMQALRQSLEPWKQELAGKTKAPADSSKIRRLAEDEVDGDEGWVRETGDPELLDLEAMRHGNAWQIVVGMAEFLRDEPLEGELRRGMDAALRAVAGVVGVDEQDREIWLVEGSARGDELLRAAAAVVDGLAPRVRDYLGGHTS